MYENGSKTLFILGEQIPTKYITQEVFQQIQEIKEFNLKERPEIDWMLFDVYMLGHINGVHDERKRRKRT